MARYVTDSHPLIWYASGQERRLGRRARDAFAAADDGLAVIFLPALALVEVLEAIRTGVFRTPRPVSQWVDGLFSTGNFQFAPLTREAILAGERLYSIPERGDRLIAATAVALGLPLISRDPDIARSGVVELLW